jgi:hypothetical protein
MAQMAGYVPLGDARVLNERSRFISRTPPSRAPLVAGCCVGNRLETAGGVFQVREDEPAPRVGARQHSIP